MLGRESPQLMADVPLFRSPFYRCFFRFQDVVVTRWWGSTERLKFFGVAFMCLLDKKTLLASTHVLYSCVCLLAPITHCRLAVLFRAPRDRDQLFPAAGNNGKDFSYRTFPWEGLFPVEVLFPASSDHGIFQVPNKRSP